VKQLPIPNVSDVHVIGLVSGTELRCK